MLRPVGAVLWRITTIISACLRRKARHMNTSQMGPKHVQCCWNHYIKLNWHLGERIPQTRSEQTQHIDSDHSGLVWNKQLHGDGNDRRNFAHSARNPREWQPSLLNFPSPHLLLSFFHSVLHWSVAVSTMRRQSSRIAAFLQADARPIFSWPMVCIHCTKPGVAGSSSPPGGIDTDVAGILEVGNKCRGFPRRSKIHERNSRKKTKILRLP